MWCNRSRVAVAAFSATVFEAFGRCGEVSSCTIRRLASRSARDRWLSDKAEVKRWFSMLSLRLALDKADTLVNG